jgi:hypothetical protein
MRSTKGDMMSTVTLRKVLRLDALASATSVVFTILGAGLLGEWLGVDTWVPLAVGFVLVPWVALLVHAGRQSPLRAGQVAVIAAGNLGWAAAAIVIIVGYPESLTTAGKWIVAVFSLGVLDLGLAQTLGWRTLAMGAKALED